MGMLSSCPRQHWSRRPVLKRTEPSKVTSVRLHCVPWAVDVDEKANTCNPRNVEHGLPTDNRTIGQSGHYPPVSICFFNSHQVAMAGMVAMAAPGKHEHHGSRSGHGGHGGLGGNGGHGTQSGHGGRSGPGHHSMRPRCYLIRIRIYPGKLGWPSLAWHGATDSSRGESSGGRMQQNAATK